MHARASKTKLHRITLQLRAMASLAPSMRVGVQARSRPTTLYPGLRAVRPRRSVATAATHRVTTLPGDGIGPEIMEVALSVLKAAGQREGESFDFRPALIGGAAYDATGDPYPEETLKACKDSDAVLLAAIGGCVVWGTGTCRLALCRSHGLQLGDALGWWLWERGPLRPVLPLPPSPSPVPPLLWHRTPSRYKWDSLPSASKPETGLLRLRSSLNAFANLRPVAVHPALAAASTLKPEVLQGVDLLIVRELVGGIYFGQPRVGLGLGVFFGGGGRGCGGAHWEKKGGKGCALAVSGATAVPVGRGLPPRICSLHLP